MTRSEEKLSSAADETMPLKVVKSLAQVLMDFDFESVAQLEKNEGRLTNLDFDEAVSMLKDDALNELLDLYKSQLGDNSWKEASHCMRYEYVKDMGFRMFYCPVSVDAIEY